MIAEGLGFIAERQVEYGSRFMPFLLSSYGCHIFNLINNEKGIYLSAGRIPDTRLQILFSAPPGFSKSMFIKSCVKEKYGLLHNPSLTLKPPYESKPAFRFMGSCCLPSGTMVEMADGTRKPVEDVHVGDEVYSLSERWKLMPSVVTNTFKQFAPIQETILENGYILPSTLNHPLRTLHGWIQACQLKIGDEVAVSMRYPEQGEEQDENLLAMLGLFIANGSFKNMVFYTIDPDVFKETESIVQKFGLIVRPIRDRGYDFVVKANPYSGKNKLKDLFREILDTNDLSLITRSKKFIPSNVFRSGNHGVAIFLRWLFTDGYSDEQLICLKQSNRAMLDDIRELLKRFNIVSSIDSSGTRLAICDLQSKRLFMKHIGFVGKHSDQLFPDKKCLGRTRGRVSSEFWDLKELNEITRTKSWNKIKRESGLSIGCYRWARSQPTHETVGVIAEFLDSDELRDLADSDVMFLRVKDIHAMESAPVYNLSVMTPNFVANGVITHNTEAGWTGSVDGSGPNVAKAIGQAEKYRNGIIGMEEFTAITSIMKQEHSRHLEQMLNMSLFEGDVEKDLKSMTISYHTDVTLLAGNQIMNFDISGGLFRRFFHILWIPRLNEALRLKNAVWRGDNIPLNVPRLLAFRAELANMWKRLEQVKSVTFHPALKDLMPSTAHHEDIVLKNFALGYTIMSDSNVPREIEVKPNEELAIHLEQAIKWRHQLLADPQGYQIISLVADLAPTGAWVPWSEVRDKALIFSVGYEQSDEIIRRLVGQKRLQYDYSKGVRIA